VHTWQHGAPGPAGKIWKWFGGQELEGSLKVQVHGRDVDLLLGSKRSSQVNYKELLTTANEAPFSKEKRTKYLVDTFFSRLDDLWFEVPFDNGVKRFKLKIDYEDWDRTHTITRDLFKMRTVMVSCDGTNLPLYCAGRGWEAPAGTSYPEQATDFWYQITVDNSEASEAVLCEFTVMQLQSTMEAVCKQAMQQQTVTEEVKGELNLGGKDAVVGGKLALGLTASNMWQLLNSRTTTSTISQAVTACFKPTVPAGEKIAFKFFWQVTAVPFLNDALEGASPLSFSPISYKPIKL
jgi:hypothetical protein